MKHVNKFIEFKSINESNESIDEDLIVRNKEDIDDIVTIMLDFIEDGYLVEFSSITGDMNYADYLSKDSVGGSRLYSRFKPSVLNRSQSVIKSWFSIGIKTGDKSYSKFVDLVTNAQSFIGRLGDSGWIFDKYLITKNDITYEFSKKDEKLESVNISTLESKILKIFKENDIFVEYIGENISWGGPGSEKSNEMEVIFQIADKNMAEMQVIFSTICNKFAFSDYDWYDDSVIFYND